MNIFDIHCPFLFIFYFLSEFISHFATPKIQLKEYTGQFFCNMFLEKVNKGQALNSLEV